MVDHAKPCQGAGTKAHGAEVLRALLGLVLCGVEAPMSLVRVAAGGLKGRAYMAEYPFCNA